MSAVAMNGTEVSRGGRAAIAPGILPKRVLKAAGRSADGGGETEPTLATPALIILGRDEQGKPHASWFADDEATTARKAAALMGMAALAVTSDELRALADQLPHGRLFASGKAFVPFVKGELFTRLAGYLSVSEQVRLEQRGSGAATSEEAAASASSGLGGVAPSEVPAGAVGTDWKTLAVGNVVIAFENQDDGWWPAVVVRVASENMYTLRWRDYPDQPTIVRSRKHIALLHPEFGVA